jgi:protein-disulfide isomerase
MASGKRSKEKRRAQAAPPVRSKGAPRRRQASPRVLLGGGAGAAVIALVVVLIVVFAGGGSAATPKGVPKIGSIAAGLPGASDVNQYLKGIPQNGLTLGSASAKVTLVEYIDLQCPFCQQFELQVLPDILTKYVRTGKVKIEARVLDFIGPDSSRGRTAMIAAGMQNRAFNYAEILYFNQGTENTGWLNADLVASAAASIPGLNVSKLLTDQSSSSVAKVASTIDTEAANDNVAETPTLLVGQSGKKLERVAITSPTDEKTLVTALDAALAG